MNRKQRRAASKQGANAASGLGQPAFVGHGIYLGDLFAQALQHFQAGRLQQAEASIRRLLAVNANHADGLHLLGLIAARVGRYDAAVDLIGRAVAIRPDFPEAHYNLGRAYRDLGALDKAEACYRRALVLKSDFAEAHMNLGNALAEQNKLDEAVACHRRALAIKPDFAEAHYNLGRAYLGQGRPDEAIAACRNALAIKPNYAEADCILGNALSDKDMPNEAELCYRRALAVKPDLAEAHYNLGRVFLAQDRPADAIAACRNTLAIKPDHVEAHYNLGLALERLARPDEAVASLRRALDIKPDYLEALSLLVKLRQQECDWDGLDADISRTLDLAGSDVEAIPPFMALTLTASAELHLANARRWAERKFACIERRFVHQWPVEERRIRLGYFSADFHVHPVAYQMTELIERHDRSRFEVIGYSCGPGDGSEVRRRLQKAFDRFIDATELTDEDVARHIHTAGIDVLVDLTGYTKNARTRILASRPAPIQVNWLGYPGTMGADFMDYIIVDRFVAPPDHQAFFTEKLVHLPHCFMPNDTTRHIAETTPTRAECGLPDEAFVFCCFSNPAKITPRFFSLWMDLLAALPGSVLWLRGEEAARRNLSKEAAARGIDPKRLVFAQRLPMAEHLARHRQADLFLDTLPYNAHATANDALWAGLPLLTLAGTSFPGRVAGSLLRAVGLPELVTASEEDYRAMALLLAREPALLGQYRQRLADNRAMAPLFEVRGFTRDIEAAYERMWQLWRNGEPSLS